MSRRRFLLSLEGKECGLFVEDEPESYDLPLRSGSWFNISVSDLSASAKSDCKGERVWRKRSLK